MHLFPLIIWVEPLWSIRGGGEPASDGFKRGRMVKFYFLKRFECISKKIFNYVYIWVVIMWDNGRLTWHYIKPHCHLDHSLKEETEQRRARNVGNVRWGDASILVVPGAFDPISVYSLLMAFHVHRSYLSGFENKG